MDERVFYDTVIFTLSLNGRDPDHEYCSALLDVDGRAIPWCIVLSCITRGEATLNEYLDQLEQRCALQGVKWLEVKQGGIQEAIRKKAEVKRQLERAGMHSRDIKQAFAAKSAGASVFITRDRDFFDPRDKARRGKKTPGTSVREVLQDELSLEPLFPSDAFDRLLAG